MENDPEPHRKAAVLIVDDHPIMRSGLAQLIAQEDDLELCGEAEDVHGALKAIEELEPDLAIVDIALKEGSGIELIKDIKVRWPKLPVLVLSMHDESFYAERVLRAGARGYVTKAEASSRVIEGVREVLKGGVYVSEKAASKMLGRLVAGGSTAPAFPIDRLTDREFEVFELIGQGLQTRQIAERLHVSVKTVDAHREHIKDKLDIGSATELLKYAVQWVQFERGA
jgi:DNA-binding NarL/FixJ family response regulator